MANSKERVMTEDNVQVIKFDAVQLPTFVESNSVDYVSFGDNNGYPQYLLELFNRSGKHNAIVTGKVHYIKGRGFYLNEGLDEKIKSQVEALMKNINEFDSGDDLLYKTATDLEIFSGIAIEVIPRKDGKGWASLNHIDRSNVRVSKDKKNIHVCDKWIDGKSKYYKPKEEDVRKLKAFDPKKFTGVFLFDQYRPGMGAYPLPEYLGCIPYIEIDIQIANFHLNNLRNGFSAGTLISFNGGQPDADKAKVIETKIKSKFAGTDNAGGLVITFSNGKDSSPTIIPLQSNNFDKLWDTLNSTSQQEIFTGHKVTNGMLFGIENTAKLGGGTGEEIRVSFELLKNGYVMAKQQMLLSCFNYLFSLNGLGEPLSIKDIEPIGFELSEAGLLQVLTKDEIRSMIGEKPAEKPDSANTENTLNALNSLSPLVATKVLDTMTENEIRALAQLPPVAGGQEIPKPAAFSNAEFSDEEKIEMFSLFGESKAKYKIHSSVDVEDRDDSYVKELDFHSNKQKFADEKPSASNPIVKVKVLWSYELRASAPPLSPGGSSRPLCKKLISLDRLYSRQEIDTISSRVGFDVWKMRGGFYHNPELDVTTDYCRHIWKQNVVSNV